MQLSFHPTEGLSVTFTPWEKMLGLRGDIKMPATRVKRAWLGMPKSAWTEFRMPGSFVPGLIKAGTYITPRGNEYWYVTRKKRHVVTLELEGCKRYARLVLGFEDPVLISSSGLSVQAPPGTFETQTA